MGSTMPKKKIIIVGNGSSILDNENGSAIDSFDIVVRFNSFKIKNHEKYTGIKTNIWFTVNKSHISEIKSFDRVIEHCWEWDKTKDKLYQELKSAFPKCEKTTRDFVRQNVPVKNPSTGLIAIFTFLHDESFVKPIYITGFDWWDRQKHHYADNEVRGTLHNPQEEYEAIKNLIDQGLVKFF